MPQPFAITISPDRMSVSLTVDAGVTVQQEDVIAAARALKLAAFDDGLIMESLARPKLEAVNIVIATGTPAVDEKPQRIEFRVPCADGQTCLISKVEAGMIVGTLIPGAPGSDGRDVFGAVVAHEPHPLTIGNHLLLTKAEIVTAVRGNLKFDGNRLSLDPLLELGDNDTRVPPKFEGDATVRGTLAEGLKIHLTGALQVGGAIDAIQLVAGGSVHAKGGVIGKQKGHYVIGGDLRCRFISGATLRVAGNVEVLGEIVHTRLDCVGTLKVAHGPICGGEVAANGGIECKTLGTPGGAVTIVEAGPGSVARKLVHESQTQIDANRQRVATVRAKIEPLMRILKQLTPAQRERVTELLSEADELETTTEDMVVTLEKHKHVMSTNGRLQVAVSDVAYPGVIIRLGEFETCIPSAFKGPFVVTTRKVGGVTEIVLLEPDAKSATVLPRRDIALRAAA